MLRRAAAALPAGWRTLAAPTLQRSFADLNLNDPAILKKYLGVEDALGKYADARGTLRGLLHELITGVETLPEASDYRSAVEATARYRLEVLDANDSDAAVEEVLDAHMEELILETKEEVALLPLMTSECAALRLKPNTRKRARALAPNPSCGLLPGRC